MSIFPREENLTTYIKRYPITSMLFAVNLILFILLTLDGGSTNRLTLLTFGALSGTLVNQGEWYRFVSSMFLHIGFTHFLLNMLTLYIFASVLERMIGKWKYVLIYFLSGLGGNVLAYTWAHEVVAAGASGALFGVLGAFLAIIVQKSHVIGATDRQILFTLVGVNLVCTFLIPGISIGGHVGGMVTGFLLMMVFGSAKKKND